jgi:hypothetical protein
MTVAKVQHYVPQFILRNFGNGKKDQLWVFDKATGRTFTTNAKNIASESRFYDFESSGRHITLEPYLCKVEDDAKPILKRIIDTDSLAALDNTDKATIARFLSIQLTRTRTFREQWREFPRMLREALATRGDQVAEGSPAANLIRDISEDDVKAETGRFMLEAPRTMAHHFLSKDWVLAATTRNRPFLTSDNPLALQNMADRPGYGTLGLNVPGIEVYLPISPVRALAIWCRSLTGTIFQVAAERRHVARIGFGDDDLEERVVALARAMSTGHPLTYSRRNVENFNSLQVAQSERYVFSSTNDFSLAKKMLATNPDLSKGPRAQAN